MQFSDDDVIAWLRKKSDKDFFDLLYRAAEGRGPDARDTGWLDSHVVLGVARGERLDEGRYGPWSLELVALPRDPAPSHADDILCQAGGHCGHDLIGWTKEIRCPLCGADTSAS